MIAALLLTIAAAGSGPVVKTEAGPVRGASLASGGGVFRGIRFAQPPLGPLRWRPPTPLRPHTAIVDAVADHAACPQPVYRDWNRAASLSGSEDCLFLDVRTPRIGRAARLPVLVWIHGGGNRGGAGGGTVESQITESGIVLVSIQYRLGALGFLSHRSLSREQGGTSGNYGLMDQQAALRWVRDNIARFGGDPARVTIAGESAGAQDVGLHMLAAGSRGLFAQAIAESGTAGFGVAPRSLAGNETLGAVIAARAGLAPTASASRLRMLPVSAIIAAQEAAGSSLPRGIDPSFIWLQAVTDGRVLRETPAVALAAGRVARVPTIIGVNAKEFTGYAGTDPRPVIAREFSRTAPRVLAAYGLTGSGTAAVDPRLGDLAMQLGTDLVFRCPAIAVSRALAGHGASVWQYQFDYAPPGGDVSHASEIRYVFDRPAPGQPPLQAYWVDFVKNGDPNGGSRPRWPRYELPRRRYIQFGQTGPEPRTNLRANICEGRDTP